MRLLLFSFILLSLALAGCGGGNGTNDANQATISGMTPSQVNPGVQGIEGRITGANLSGVTAVELGAGVELEQFSPLSESEIYIFFSVQRDAPPGPRTITVVTAAGAAQSSTAFTVGDNSMPQARFTVTPPIGYKATVFKFDASSSNDLDGGIVSYQWHFGDGGNRSGKVVNYQFERAGTLPARLTVTDNRGGTHQVERLMEIDPSRTPIATFHVSPATGNVNTTFHFDASGSRDPDGRINSYIWNFGDGASAQGMVVEHKYAAENTYTPGLSVRDNTGQTGIAHSSIHVDKDPGPPPGDDDDDGGGGGGGGGTCDANNFFTNYFTVVSASDNTIVADQEFRMCPGLCGEVRRPGVDGVKEFVGDVVNISGAVITVSFGSLPNATRAQPGERLNILWKTCGD